MQGQLAVQITLWAATAQFLKHAHICLLCKCSILNVVYLCSINICVCLCRTKCWVGCIHSFGHEVCIRMCKECGVLAAVATMHNKRPLLQLKEKHFTDGRFFWSKMSRTIATALASSAWQLGLYHEEWFRPTVPSLRLAGSPVRCKRASSQSLVRAAGRAAASRPQTSTSGICPEHSEAEGSLDSIAGGLYFWQCCQGLCCGAVTRQRSKPNFNKLHFWWLL